MVGRDRRARRLVVRARRRMRNSALQKIERRRWGITIRRGGSHRQTQRLERSIRTDSTVLGDPAVFCADFLYAEGCTFVGLVQQYFAGEPSCAELHWASGRNYRGNLLSIHRRRCVPFGSDSAGLRRSETVLPEPTHCAAV